MGRHSGIKLSSKQEHALHQFMIKTKDKREYRAASGILLRNEKKSAENVAHHLGVTIKQVFAWTRFFRAKGIVGLHMKKPTGRTPKKSMLAKPRIQQLLKEDPQLFGYLKGGWVLRDISRQLKKEGINLHFTGVRRVLEDLNLVLKSPKMRAIGSIKKNYWKRKEIENYKRIAPALQKKRLHLHFKTRNG